MFERNPVDSRSETLLAVEITLADGAKVTGRAVLRAGKGVHRLLEGDETFLYVDGFDGDGAFIAKADIKSLKVLHPARPQALSLPVPDARGFEPYRVLGLEKGASFEEIRDAYYRLSKLYHPDRYASIDLPREVKTYLDAVAKNVNVAFRALRYVADKQAPPIYTRSS